MANNWQRNTQYPQQQQSSSSNSNYKKPEKCPNGECLGHYESKFTNSDKNKGRGYDSCTVCKSFVRWNGTWASQQVVPNNNYSPPRQQNFGPLNPVTNYSANTSMIDNSNDYTKLKVEVNFLTNKVDALSGDLKISNQSHYRHLDEIQRKLDRLLTYLEGDRESDQNSMK